jgi:formate dehydrogenase maturation protein FdhE
MKKVVSRSEVARLWARQAQDEARERGDRMYFNNNAIYSYGSHFMIAKIVDGNKCLFTLDTYSNTTAKHINEARSAAHRAGLDIIHCISPDGSIERNINHWKEAIKRLIEEIRNPKNRKFSTRIINLQSAAEQMRKYIDFMKNFRGYESTLEDELSMSFILNNSGSDLLIKLRNNG